MDDGKGVERRLERIELLLAVIAKSQLKRTLDEELKDDKMRKLYRLTGSATRAEIARATGFSTGKVSLIWQRWEEAGMVAKDGKGYKRTI